MARKKKSGTSKVHNFEHGNEYTYGELSSALYVYSIKAYKKISLQKEIIDTLKHEINTLNRALDCLRKLHTSLMEELCIVSDTLA